MLQLCHRFVTVPSPFCHRFFTVKNLVYFRILFSNTRVAPRLLQKCEFAERDFVRGWSSLTTPNSVFYTTINVVYALQRYIESFKRQKTLSPADRVSPNVLGATWNQVRSLDGLAVAVRQKSQTKLSRLWRKPCDKTTRRQPASFM